MSESLVSGSWHRVETLRPSLVPGLRIVRQQVRDQVWRLLVEPGSGRQLRLNPGAWDLVGRFDGRATLGDLWRRVLHLRRDAAPTQDEVLALLAQLFRGGMVQFDATPHLSLLFARRAQEGVQRSRGIVNPFMLRTRLADPSRWLQRLTPLANVVFSVPMLACWLALLSIAALAGASEFAALRAHATQLLARPSSYAVAWLLYPLVKALHELGHGLAVRRFGGEVHEVGVTLMFLTPAPYVDASAASAFASRGQRFVVSAAGIMVELALAALALGLWTLVAPGWVRDAALAVVLICSVSTLLFNGNPLMRLDGYHALCDALQLPNLAARSKAWWMLQWSRRSPRRRPAARARRAQMARVVRAAVGGVSVVAAGRTGAVDRPEMVAGRLLGRTGLGRLAAAFLVGRGRGRQPARPHRRDGVGQRLRTRSLRRSRTAERRHRRCGVGCAGRPVACAGVGLRAGSGGRGREFGRGR